uniref:Uncharacterized protein n=1 Tax=Timema shepardi TaxID=629360 RepID=A0A7R9G6Y8_TIMSH|nr:unnamed protein product [Timema shepardi]
MLQNQPWTVCSWAPSDAREVTVFSDATQHTVAGFTMNPPVCWVGYVRERLEIIRAEVAAALLTLNWAHKKYPDHNIRLGTDNTTVLHNTIPGKGWCFVREDIRALHAKTMHLLRDIQVSTFWVPSELNPADAVSRRDYVVSIREGIEPDEDAITNLFELFASVGIKARETTARDFSRSSGGNPTTWTGINHHVMTRIAKSPPSAESVNNAYREAGLEPPYAIENEDNLWAWLQEDPEFQNWEPEELDLALTTFPEEGSEQDYELVDLDQLPSIEELQEWIGEAQQTPPAQVETDVLSQLITNLGIDIDDEPEEHPEATEFTPLDEIRDSGDPTDIIDDKDEDDAASPGPFIRAPRVPLTWDAEDGHTVPAAQCRYESVHVAPLQSQRLRERTLFLHLREGVVLPRPAEAPHVFQKTRTSPLMGQPGTKVMILPHVKDEDLPKLFPKGVEKISMPSGIIYVRTTTDY